jgi:hypothetical protein
MQEESKNTSTAKDRDNQESDQLLQRLRRTNDADLGHKVEKTEGVNGSTLEPVYSSRKMVCYSVTESELRQLNLANIGITGLTSLGSAMLAFWLDVFKDTTLAGSIPEEAEILISYVQPLLLVFGIGFWVLAGFLLFWRRNLVKLIKDES